jgi:hypothetical protein
MPKYLCALLVLFTLAVGAVGCGGDDKPSKEEFAADLDNVCAKSNEKVQKVKAPKTVKEIGTFTRATRPILEDSIKEAEELELPEEDADGFEAYIQSSKSSLSELDDLEKAADAGDVKAVRRVFAETTKGNNERDAQAKKLGLKKCGTG